MKIIIPFKTPSINMVYWHRGNIKIMTAKGRECRKEILEIMSEIDKEDIEALKDELLKVTIEVYENWFTKVDNMVRKTDVANREKFLIDSVFEGLGIDDRFIFELTVKKMPMYDIEKAIVTIEVLDV